MSEKNPVDWLKKHEYALLSLIIAAGFIFRVFVYTRYSYSYGVDGAYYNLQVQSILDTGLPYREDTPLVFYFHTLISLLLGDVTLGVKVGTSLLSALIAAPLFYLTRRATGSWWAGYVSAFIGLFNPLHVRMLDDFYKNLAGILLMLLFLQWFLRACEKPTRRNLVVTFTLLALTFLTHIHPSGLSLLFVAGYVTILWITEGKPPEAELKVSMWLLRVLAVGFIAALVLLPGAVSKFTKIFSLLSNLEQVDVDAGGLLGLKQLLQMLSIPSVLGLTYILKDLKSGEGGREKSLLVSIFIISMFLVTPFIPDAFRWRFTLGNFLPAALLAGYGFARVSRSLPRVVFTGLLAVLLLSSSYEAWEAGSRLGPEIDDDGVAALTELGETVPDNSAIMVRGQFHYWVQLVTGLPTVHGFDNPTQLHNQHGGPVYLIMEKARPPLPDLKDLLIYEIGPYRVYQLYPGLG